LCSVQKEIEAVSVAAVAKRHDQQQRPKRAGRQLNEPPVIRSGRSLG
jgi:hypothetical protein